MACQVTAVLAGLKIVLILSCTAQAWELCSRNAQAMKVVVLQVNYNYDEYDRTIKDAIRGGKNEILAAPSRPQRDWSRYVFAAVPG